MQAGRQGGRHLACSERVVRRLSVRSTHIYMVNEYVIPFYPAVPNLAKSPNCLGSRVPWRFLMYASRDIRIVPYPHPTPPAGSYFASLCLHPSLSPQSKPPIPKPLCHTGGKPGADPNPAEETSRGGSATASIDRSVPGGGGGVKLGRIKFDALDFTPHHHREQPPRLPCDVRISPMLFI